MFFFLPFCPSIIQQPVPLHDIVHPLCLPFLKRPLLRHYRIRDPRPSQPSLLSSSITVCGPGGLQATSPLAKLEPPRNPSIDRHHRHDARAPQVPAQLRLLAHAGSHSGGGRWRWSPPRTRAAPWFHPELPARQKEKELIPRMQKLLCPPQRTPLEGCQVINTSETDALSCTVSANCVRPGGVNPTQVALGHVKDVCDIMVII